MEVAHPIRLVICDDHQIVIDGLRRLLEDVAWVQVVGTATGGEELMALLEHGPADLVILDLNMPGLPGSSVMQKVKGRWPGLRVIILTMETSAAMVRHMMQMGAEGYLAKTCGREELLHAIQQVHGGGKHVPGSGTADLARAADPVIGGRLDALSGREREVLAGLAEGLSNKEIGERLYISHRTVDTHRTNLMKKLGVHNLAELVRIAIAEGIVR